MSTIDKPQIYAASLSHFGSASVDTMKVKVGDTASLTRKVTDEDIRTFAEVTGDRNPIHLEDGFAATTRFGRRIAHGVFGASLISAVLGNELPGQPDPEVSCAGLS